jgi:hypothetical protein
MTVSITLATDVIEDPGGYYLKIAEPIDEVAYD